MIDIKKRYRKRIEQDVFYIYNRVTIKSKRKYNYLLKITTTDITTNKYKALLEQSITDKRLIKEIEDKIKKRLLASDPEKEGAK